MARNVVEILGYMMKVVRNVVTDEKLSKKCQYVGTTTTTSVKKYAVMEKFMKKLKEHFVVVSKHTTPRGKFVATKSRKQNSSAKESAIITGHTIILDMRKQNVIIITD